MPIPLVSEIPPGSTIDYVISDLRYNTAHYNEVRLHLTANNTLNINNLILCNILKNYWNTSITVSPTGLHVEIYFLISSKLFCVLGKKP